VLGTTHFLPNPSARFSSYTLPSSAPHVLAFTHALLQATPPKLIQFKTSINAAADLIRLPHSLLRRIAELVGAPERLCFSNVCRTLRSILLEDPQLWNRVFVRNTPSEIAMAHWERAGQSPLHLSWMAYKTARESSENMRDHSNLVAQFLPRLQTLSLRYISSLTHDGPRHIGDFLTGEFDAFSYRWVPVPEAFFRWSLRREDGTYVPAEQLEVLSIDFGSSWTPQSAWDSRMLAQHTAQHWHLRWQIPSHMLSTAANLRTLILRGAAYPTDAMMVLGGLREFAYSGATTLTYADLDRLLECMPLLEGLALGCPFKRDNQRSRKHLNSEARPARIAITGEGASRDDPEAMLAYFVERNMEDIVVVTADITDITLDPNPSREASRVSHDVGCISFNYDTSEGVRRIRRCTGPRSFRNYTSTPFWASTIVDLTIHEGIWEGIVALSIRFARLELLRIRFRRRWDRIYMAHEGTSSFFFTKPGLDFEAPKLRVLELSGDRTPRFQPGHMYPDGVSCACCGAASISLQDVRDAVAQYPFPSLERIRVCNLHCVDLDFAGAMAKLLDLVPFVDVEPAEVYRQEVQPLVGSMQGSALEIFKSLEDPRVVQEGEAAVLIHPAVDL